MSEITEQQLHEAYEEVERLYIDVRKAKQGLSIAEDLHLGAQGRAAKLQHDYLQQEKARVARKAGPAFPNGRYASVEQGGV